MIGAAALNYTGGYQHDLDSNRFSEAEENARSRLTSAFDSATGITTTYTYQQNTNYTSQETVTSNLSPVTLAVYTYTYRNDGLKTGAVEYLLNSDGSSDTVTLSWNYDGLDRVTQETSTDTTGTAALNYTDNYQYDLTSNRVSETTDANGVNDTITSTYNADNELTQAVDANTGTTVYTYDPNGSQIGITHTPNGTTTPDSTTTNEYDLQGQLAGSQVTTAAGTAKTIYYYDDSGNRIKEVTVAAGSTTPVTTYYLVDTNNPTGYSQPIEQAATPGTPQITYVWGSQLISETYAQGATIPGVGTAASPTTYYILTDAHGSTRLVTNATGGVVETMNYDAFGNALGFNASTALTTYLYSSMPFDAASGNYYDHARYVDTGTGSFTQADYGYTGSLANPMTGLPYMYGGGDPTNMLDLNGHQDEMEELAVESIGSWLDAAFSRGVQVASEFARPVIALLTGGASWMATQGQNALLFLQNMGTGAITFLQQSFMTQTGVISEEQAEAAPSWDTFGAARTYLNKLITGGENNPEDIQWHHLVSQLAQRTQGFAARAINSAANIVPTPSAVHTAITSFFGSGAEWLPLADNGSSYATTQQYVTSLSWNQQYQIGLKIWQAAMYNQNLQEVGKQIVLNSGQ